MARKKKAVYMSEKPMKASKISAARAGKEDYQILEEALRQYLGLSLLKEVWQRSKLGETAALRIAYKELRSSRR